MRRLIFNAVTAKMRLVQIAEEIISVLRSDPNASLKVVVEISSLVEHLYTVLDHFSGELRIRIAAANSPNNQRRRLSLTSYL